MTEYTSELLGYAVALFVWYDLFVSVGLGQLCRETGKQLMGLMTSAKPAFAVMAGMQPFCNYGSTTLKPSASVEPRCCRLSRK